MDLPMVLNVAPLVIVALRRRGVGPTSPLFRVGVTPGSLVTDSDPDSRGEQDAIFRGRA